MIFCMINRRRASENETYQTAFLLPDKAAGQEETYLRTVIAGFLKTDDGKQAIEDTMNDFNWGDVSTYIPSGFLAQFGIKELIHGETFGDIKNYCLIDVDQDECLIPDSES